MCCLPESDLCLSKMQSDNMTLMRMKPQDECINDDFCFVLSRACWSQGGPSPNNPSGVVTCNFLTGYCSLGPASTLTKQLLLFFQENSSFLYFQIINNSWFTIYDIVIHVVNLFRLWLAIIMKVFHALTSYFHKD
jgi:hypothetical protein